ncbi:MAG TPA: phage tail protein [Chromatiales bacterium]|nr:phage tail protein [Chromatiales bacterium]
MDINNTPFILLRNEDEFEHGSSRLHWNRKQQSLCLAQNQTLRLPQSTAASAMPEWQASTPLALDNFNQIARLSNGEDRDKTEIEFNSGRGFLPLQDDELRRVAAPEGVFTDLILGGDSLLAAPFSNGSDAHGLLLFHLGKRWQAHCRLPLEPRRGWLDSANRCWVVSANHLMLCEGEPLPLPYKIQPQRFEPVTVNPRALAFSWQAPQPLPVGLQALAICGDDEALYILCHDGADQQLILRRSLSFDDESPFALFPLDDDIPFVIDLSIDSGPAAPGRLAALAPRQAGDSDFVQRDCAVLELLWDSEAETGSARLIRERYPMLSNAMPRFVSSADGQLRYQADIDPDYPDLGLRPRELHVLRRQQFHRQASALLHHILDSGQPDTLWHRIYLDASIPPGCQITLSVRVYNTPGERGSAPLIDQPAPVWNPLPSELAYAESLAGQKSGESGLFEVLIQRPDGPVRRLNGRYLQIQLHMTGNVHQSPQLHALRVYYPRFSYQEAYLPELFRQELSFDADSSSGSANGADIRERLLAVFESILTPIEGRVAAADRLSHPQATPVENLAWLGEILGTQLPPHWPEKRQRRLIQETGLIQQYKGSLAGLNLALDVVTDGGVQRGEVVVVENFRLRRTMATILGISMDDSDHPLTLGTGMSGNSLVGESLILSEKDARTFLALFSPELANKDEAEIVKIFFEDYAHQISILLHGRGIQRRDQVEITLEEQMPAHLVWRILETEHPFVLGIAPLLAVDTFIETTPDFRRVALNETWLGKEGVIKNPAAFSPWDINAQMSQS